MTIPGPLGPEAIEHFRQKGWLVMPGFFPREEAASLTRWTEEVTAMPEVPGKQMVYYETSEGSRLLQRVEDFCPYHPAMDGLAREGKLAQAMAQLFGGAAALFKDKINFKLAGGGGFELHQDQQAGWSVYAPFFVTALVSIDRATIANGCLEIADMPRAEGLLGPEWRPLTLEELGGNRLIPVPTEPGDVIFFDSFVAHASKRNSSDGCRRVLYLTYNRLADGDHRARYFHDKRQSFPPDIERVPGREYKFRV